MHCPKCLQEDTRVIDSRLLQEGSSVRRRRKCEACEHRFTTYERIDATFPNIVKRDGRREPFRREKIQDGLEKAFQKRPVRTDCIQNVIDALETALLESKKKEWNSEEVGTFLTNKIKELDPVAYVRFASFYWDFQDVDGFVNSLNQETSLNEGSYEH